MSQSINQCTKSIGKSIDQSINQCSANIQSKELDGSFSSYPSKVGYAFRSQQSAFFNEIYQSLHHRNALRNHKSQSGRFENTGCFLLPAKNSSAVDWKVCRRSPRCKRAEPKICGGIKNIIKKILMSHGFFTATIENGKKALMLVW